MSKRLIDQGGREEGAEGTMISGGVLQRGFIWFQLLIELHVWECVSFVRWTRVYHVKI